MVLECLYQSDARHSRGVDEGKHCATELVGGIYDLRPDLDPLIKCWAFRMMFGLPGCR